MPRFAFGFEPSVRTDSRNATPPWAWRSEFPPLDSFALDVLARPAAEVAPALLGQRIVSDLGGKRTEGVIVEVEAYIGPQDPASHAAERIGRTRRNASMFGAPGTAYVYLIYGMHWCLNVVTDRVGLPSAVLVRAVDPIAGEATMLERRGRPPVASGPGRLCQALGITGDLDGHDLSTPPLSVAPGWSIPGDRIGTSGRIGVRNAADWPLRFYIAGHPAVSG